MIALIRSLFKRRGPWEYGICREVPSRRHRKTGEVQFVLWKAGEQGHETDYWHPFDAYWWPQFKMTPGRSPEKERKIG